MTVRGLTALSFAILFLSAAALPAQEVTIGDVKRGRHNNEVVTVSGEVVGGPRVATATVQGYYLKSRDLDIILVKTTDTLPDLKSEFTVTGIAQVDADTREVFIQEQKRALINRPQPPLPPPPPQPWWQSSTSLLIAIGALVLILIALAVFLMRRQAAASAPSLSSGGLGSSDAAESLLPPSDTMDEFKTVKVYKTTKVLPGTLVVMEGGRETDVIYLSDQSGRGDIEIGRDSPDSGGGIRIKDRSNTVSRHQAKLVYSADAREFRLVNLATEASNPTIVNGKPLAAAESVVLADGDILGMGTLEVKFRKR